jgi:hypothetical protein
MLSTEAGLAAIRTLNTLLEAQLKTTSKKLTAQHFHGISSGMDLRRLRVFMTVAEKRSFTKASFDLKTTRSTVSVCQSALKRGSDAILMISRLRLVGLAGVEFFLGNTSGA